METIVHRSSFSNLTELKLSVFLIQQVYRSWYVHTSKKFADVIVVVIVVSIQYVWINTFRIFIYETIRKHIYFSFHLTICTTLCWSNSYNPNELKYCSLWLWLYVEKTKSINMFASHYICPGCLVDREALLRIHILTVVFYCVIASIYWVYFSSTQQLQHLCQVHTLFLTFPSFILI